MITLIVRQQRIDGASKVWKLKPSDETHSFGTSRLAEIISISPEAKGIEGSFEYRNGNWWYIDLNKDFKVDSTFQIISLEKPHVLKRQGYELHLNPIEISNEVFSNIENNSEINEETNLILKVEDSSKLALKHYQIFLVKRNNKIIEYSILPFGEKFISKFMENKSDAIEPVESNSWVRKNWDDLLIQQKSIHLRSVDDLSKVKWNQLMDDESRKGLKIMGSFILAVFLLSFILPKSERTSELPTFAKSPQSFIVKTEIKKPQQKNSGLKASPSNNSSVNAKNPRAESPAPPQEMKNTKSNSKTAGLLKNFTQGRISQLISKVSAQAARSANVVISKGIKAESAESGAALSSLGNVDRSGRDWAREAKGNDIKISTGGKGGGQSTLGMGGLIKGGTGSAGVGLIEDESEISGGLDREIIAQYIKSQLGQILYCYERQLSAHPDLFGKVAVRFTIGPIGTVETQAINDTTLKNATVEGCILKKVAAWKFPIPQGGTKVMVTYPFLFKSTN